MHVITQNKTGVIRVNWRPMAMIPSTVNMKIMRTVPPSAMAGRAGRGQRVFVKSQPSGQWWRLIHCSWWLCIRTLKQSFVNLIVLYRISYICLYILLKALIQLGWIVVYEQTLYCCNTIILVTLSINSRQLSFCPFNLAMTGVHSLCKIRFSSKLMSATYNFLNSFLINR